MNKSKSLLQARKRKEATYSKILIIIQTHLVKYKNLHIDLLVSTDYSLLCEIRRWYNQENPFRLMNIEANNLFTTALNYYIQALLGSKQSIDQKAISNTELSFIDQLQLMFSDYCLANENNIFHSFLVRDGYVDQVMKSGDIILLVKVYKEKMKMSDLNILMLSMGLTSAYYNDRKEIKSHIFTKEMDEYVTYCLKANNTITYSIG